MKNERVAIVFDRFDDAMEVHKNLFTMIREKGFVSYRDFINITEYRDDRIPYGIYDTHGWTYLCGTEVELYSGDRWIITMPEIIELDLNNIKIEKENDQL